jgi:hypothetical protein
MVGHLTAAIDAEERCRRLGRVKAKKAFISPAAEGVTGRVFEQQHCVWAVRIRQQPLLQLLLPSPGLRERHQPRRLKTDCVARGGNHPPFLAFE